MRVVILFILGLILGTGAGISADRLEPTKGLISKYFGAFFDRFSPPLPPPLPAAPPLLLAIGQNAFTAAELSPFAIEPCFPRADIDVPEERPWLVREYNTNGLVPGDSLPPSPDLSAYPGLIKIEGIRSPLGTEREHCAAVRVAPNWFLTAAHCIIDLDIRTAKPTYDVIAITPSSDVRSEGTQVVPLAGAICHSAYGMNRQQYSNDIALFYLEDVSAFESVAIADLESSEMGLIASDLVTPYISGWGKNGGTRYLQGGPVNIVEAGESVLIGERIGPKGPNVGDSGAPLYLAREAGAPIVIGTLSQVTQDENEDGDRSIYIRTKTVEDWITRTMAICGQNDTYVCAAPDPETDSALDTETMSPLPLP